MGSYNSGWYRGGKSTIEEHRNVDIRRWYRDGLLPRNAPQSRNSHVWSWTQDGERIASITFRTAPNHVTLNYNYTPSDHEPILINQQIQLDWTPLHFGGERPWFLCPGCERRVSILYLSGAPACRHCYRLTYTSRNQSDTDRGIDQCHKMQSRYGGDGGALGDLGWKPKNMHWTTWNRLQWKHYKHQRTALSGISRKFNIPT